MCCSTPGVGVLFCSVPLPFDSDGLLPFTSDGLKGFWFCFLARKVLGLLARSSGSASGQGRFWGSWRGVLVLPPGVEGSRAPGEEFWFCSWGGVLVLLLARSSGSAPGVGVLLLLPGVEDSGAPGVGVLFYSWRRRSGSVPLPFNSDGLLPFGSDGLKGF